MDTQTKKMLQRGLLFCILFLTVINFCLSQDILNLSENSADSEYPAIAVNHRGEVLVVWSDGGTIFYKLFRDGSWSGTADTGLREQFAIISQLDVDSDGNFHISYSDGYSSGSRDIFYSMYSLGSGWGSPERVCYNNLNSAWNRIAVDGNEVYIMWFQEVGGGDEAEIALNSKVIGGSWSDSWENVSRNPRETSIHPAFDVKDGNVYSCYMAGTESAWDITFSERIQGYWQTPVAIGDSHWPGLCVDDNHNVFAVFYSSYGNRLYFRERINGEWNVLEDIRTAQAEKGFSDVKVKNNVVVAAWSQATEFGSSIFYRHKEVGSGWMEAEELDRGTEAYYPLIALDDEGYAHIVWEDIGVSGQRDIFYRKVFLTCPPLIFLSPLNLNFGENSLGDVTPAQHFDIRTNGCGSLTWEVEENAAWISCAPLSGLGEEKVKVSVSASGLLPGEYTEAVMVSSPEAYNSPQIVTVTLTVYDVSQDAAPFGSFDTPSAESVVSGSLPVTGWALDDFKVTKVEIKRDPDPDDPAAAIGLDGLIYIGDAVFVNGSRPDVEALYPDYPLNDRAGWGYMMLTYGMPRLGNGTFKLYAFAEDRTGHRVLLGTKQIICDNANRVQPFGTIDTPNQGETISGSYVNFGWVLTPPPKFIPTDGSTVWISIDGIYIAHPDYNHFRQDVFDAFPGYANRDGAIGFYWIDTTMYSDGMHNIGWYAVDNEGQADGFGSRFFEIQNLRGTTATAAGMEGLKYRENARGRLKISVEGLQEIEAEQLERIKIQFKGEGGNRIIGWGADETKCLPIGSTLDGEKGVFYWSIGPGFLNRHVLHFAVIDGVYISSPVQVVVNVIPKRYEIDREKKDD